MNVFIYKYSHALKMHIDVKLSRRERAISELNSMEVDTLVKSCLFDFVKFDFDGSQDWGLVSIFK